MWARILKGTNSSVGPWNSLWLRQWSTKTTAKKGRAFQVGTTAILLGGAAGTVYYQTCSEQEKRIIRVTIGGIGRFLRYLYIVDG